MKELNQISPNEFCKRLGLNKAIETKHAARQKKRLLSKVLESFDIIDQLGFKIEIKPK